MNIDLDQARTARREVSGEAPTVTFNGKTHDLPVELPFEIAETISRMQATNDPAHVVRAVEIFLGPVAAEFFESHPSVQDVAALVEGLSKAYGFADVGESPASAASS